MQAIVNAAAKEDEFVKEFFISYDKVDIFIKKYSIFSPIPTVYSRKLELHEIACANQLLMETVSNHILSWVRSG